MKRKQIPAIELTALSVSLAASLIASAFADDTKADKSDSAPAEKAAPKAKPDAADAKKGTAEAVKEDPEAALLSLFKKEASITNTLGMVMVWVPKGYRVDRYEVTQNEFESIMHTNQSKFKGDSRPVDNVTWEEAAEFCKKLTEKEQAAGKLPKTYSYTLPSESDWEYYVDEATLKDAITSYLGDRKNSENVGGLAPNKFGLYDVRGNVWEWMSTPVARGGSWRTYEDLLEISFRYAGAAGTRYDDIGFRCVLRSP